MNFFVSPKEFFTEAVKEGVRERKAEISPRAEGYLIDLLQFYLDARNLFQVRREDGSVPPPTTLAEMYLVANQSESAVRTQILKQLGDRSLYISGFFGDSLKRKVVDVDYYVEMGGTAYRDLAESTSDEPLARMFGQLSKRFVEYVDVLTYISQKSLVQSDKDILRLYETYIKTGSELARDRLTEKGIVLLPPEQIKKSSPF